MRGWVVERSAPNYFGGAAGETAAGATAGAIIIGNVGVDVTIPVTAPGTASATLSAAIDAMTIFDGFAGGSPFSIASTNSMPLTTRPQTV